MLQLKFLLPQLAFVFLTLIYLSSVGPASIVLWQMVFWRSFILYFNFFFFFTVVFVSFLCLPSSSIQAWVLKQHHSSFTFFYLFLQYIFLTLGLLVYSFIKYPRVPPQFIQVYFNILYNMKVAFLLHPLYYSGFNIQLQGGNISFLLKQYYGCLLIFACYTPEAGCLDLLKQFKE